LQRDKFGKLALEELYQMIRKLYPKRRLFVVQDNCSFHYSDNVLQTAEALDIHPVFLPTYASWLNPIEKLWRWLKADVLHAHEFAHNIQLLRQTVAQFLDQFSSPSPALLRYVGLLPD
jgi:transposase